MLTTENIEERRQLLDVHRNTLSHLLRQAAKYGGIDFSPTATANGIVDTRNEIAHIKEVLRAEDIEVPDLPDDLPSSSEQASTPTSLKRSRKSVTPRNQSTVSEPYQHNRQMFINDMRRRFKEQLAKVPKVIKLRFAERHGAVERPGEVINPYDVSRQQSAQNDVVLSAQTRLIDLYDQHNGQLLILGARGAGKTFLLYELAQELVERAASDPNAPVPVIFSLATWKSGYSFEQWMIADLSQRYGVKPQFIRQFFTSGMILPLLDGLDEIDTFEHRKKCVEVINTYRQSRDVIWPLVVTCRERDYQNLPLLKLNAALVIQPLTSAQINRYLSGDTFAPLQQALEQDAALADLANTPLLLTMMAEIYRNRAPQLPPDADQTTLHQTILSNYVTHCSTLPTNDTTLRVPMEQLRAFLAWLARGMIAHNNQQEFYIETLQSSWLPSKWWRGLSGLMFGLGIGLIFGLVIGPFMANSGEPEESFFIRIIIGLFIGLLFGMANGLVFEILFVLYPKLEGVLIGGLVHEGKVRNRANWRSFRSALVFGSLFGLINTLILNLLPTPESELSQVSLIELLFFGIICAMIGGFVVYFLGVRMYHHTIRLLIARSTPAPRNMLSWLDEAHLRGLLIRTGNGYRFYHELLERYFASYEEPGFPRVSILAEQERRPKENLIPQLQPSKG